jgi:hypothetical protein
MADKVTIRQFGEKLKEYKNGSAARKAVGRFNGWSEEEKNKARRMIDAQFGPIDDKPAPKKISKKAPKVKAAKAAKAPKAEEPRQKRAYHRRTPVAAAAPVVPDQLMNPLVGTSPLPPSFGVLSTGAHALHIAERTIIQCAIVVETSVKVHGALPSLDLTATFQGVIDAQNKALRVFTKELDGLELTEEKVPRRVRNKAEVPKGNGKLEAAVGDSDDTVFATAPAPVPTQI